MTRRPWSLATGLALTLACATFAGAAFAGNAGPPPGQENATTPPGNSENTPAAQNQPAPAPQSAPQAQANVQAEPAPAPASSGKSANAPGQTKTEKAASPSKGKSASAPGHRKTGKAATPPRGKSETPRAQTRSDRPQTTSQGDGRLRTAGRKVLICHATGSESNPYVVISVSVNALKSGHDQLGTREAVLAPNATQPGRRTADVHGGRTDIILGPSSPGRIANKAALEAQCAQLAEQQGVPTQPTAGVQQLRVTAPQQPAIAAQAQPTGGVAGAEAVISKQKPAAKSRPAGGVLGEIAAIGRRELPFTGLPLWIATLIGVGLVGAGFGARRLTS